MVKRKRLWWRSRVLGIRSPIWTLFVIHIYITVTHNATHVLTIETFKQKCSISAHSNCCIIFINKQFPSVHLYLFFTSMALFWFCPYLPPFFSLWDPVLFLSQFTSLCDGEFALDWLILSTGLVIATHNLFDFNIADACGLSGMEGKAEQVEETWSDFMSWLFFNKSPFNS